MRSRRVLAGLTLLVAACADPDGNPVGPAPLDRTPSFAISDATVGGRAGFYFRPPIADALAAYPGTFDGGLLSTLRVTVCPIGLPSSACVEYTSSSKPALKVDLAKQTYGVTWSPQTTGDFRAQVSSGGTLLGFADIRVAENGKQLTDVPEGYAGVVKNGSLPIRFRVEAGLVASLTLAPTTGVAIVSLQTVTFTATATDLHGATISGPSLSWSSSDPGIATVSATGVASGVSEGDATITASSGGVAAAAALTVIGDLNTVIGTAARFIPRADACGEFAGRTCESLVGNVVTDAMRATYGVDVAITNSGGLRADLTCPTTDITSDTCPSYVPPPYQITRGQVRRVLPFGNRVVIVSVNGAELKAMLENAVARYFPADNRFGQVSGICFTYDIAAPRGSRVTAAVRQASDGTCTGAEVDLTAGTTYTIAENDFMAAGGDGYPIFAGRGTTMELLDRVTSAYIAANSPIAPSIQGRITCTSTGSVACPVTP